MLKLTTIFGYSGGCVGECYGSMFEGTAVGGSSDMVLGSRKLGASQVERVVGVIGGGTSELAASTKGLGE